MNDDIFQLLSVLLTRNGTSRSGRKHNQPGGWRARHKELLDEHAEVVAVVADWYREHHNGERPPWEPPTYSNEALAEAAAGWMAEMRSMIDRERPLADLFTNWGAARTARTTPAHPPAPEMYMTETAHWPPPTPDGPHLGGGQSTPGFPLPGGVAALALLSAGPLPDAGAPSSTSTPGDGDDE